ncbi:MAG: DUF6057 family protein [Ignavibacteriales bacterium]|nr:DUF6057 family protein [Ignavibacteriales bacterium]
MNLLSEKYRLAQISVWVQEGIFLLACFFYLLLRIHPIFILEVHAPVFLSGSDFLYDFFKTPGGLVNWLSAFLMQFWFSDFLSSLFLAVCFWIVGFLTRKWIETLTENHTLHTFHLIPACLLIVLYSNYDFDLSVTLAIIINLFILVLYIRWSPKQQVIRLGLGLVIIVLLYWFTGGAFLLFAVLYGLENLLFKRNFVNGFLFLLISALLPFAASRSVFLINLKQAYLHNLTFENSIDFWIIAYSIPAFFLLTLLITFIVTLPGIRKQFSKLTRIAYGWKLAAGTIFLLSGTILLAKDSTNDIKKLVIQVNRAVSEEHWTDVLELTRHSTIETPLLLCQTNLALFQTDKLLDSMFAFPQSKGMAGLLMNQTWCLAWSEEASNVSWKLGLVNESQHWASEALEHKGHTPDLLKRLGMVYMVKGDHKAANRFFLNLKKVPFKEKIAEDLIRLNENPLELDLNSEYKYIRSCMLVEDLISVAGPTLPELELLLKQNPKNKMAFEYLIACYLLNGNVKEIWNLIPYIAAMTSFKIPRHVQEALMVNAALTPKFDLSQLKKIVHPLNFNRFVEYEQIFRKYGGNKNSAQQYLKIQFGDTYWYYLMFVKPSSRQSENQNEYQ